MKKKVYFLIASCFLYTSGMLSAQNTKTWTGSENSSWNNANNWSPKGKPGKDDHVIISSGTPTVEIKDNQTHSKSEAKSVTNNGTLEMKDGTLMTTQLTNNGTVKVSNTASYKTNTIEGLTTTGEGANVINNGTINPTINHPMVHGNLTISGKNVENNGSITTTGTKINANSFVNNQGASVHSTEYDGTTTISCKNSIVNKGTITTETHKQSGISLSANRVVNEGEISTGEGYNQTKTGDIKITAKNVTNDDNGVIRTGKSSNPEIQGKITVKGSLDNYGKIQSGKSPGKILKSRQEQYFNNVDLVGDSIFLYGDSTRIEADTLRLYFNYLEIAFVTQYASIWGDMVVEFYGSGDAVADLSSPDNGAGIISVGYGGISFFCDNILEPPLGLNYICDLPPAVGPSDTTITGAFANDGFQILQTGTSGQIQVAFQNQSTLPKSFQYTVTDQKGWVQAASGTTALIDPFLFDSLTFGYTIPNLPDSVPDTVFITLSHEGESILAEAIWVLYPYQESLSGINDNNQTGKNLMEVYPVPFYNNLFIRALEDINVTILDASGKALKRVSLKKEELLKWTPSAPAFDGLYFVHASEGKDSYDLIRVISLAK